MAILVTPPLDPAQVAYLRRFAEVRHVARDPSMLEDVADPLREAVGLPLGPEAQYALVGADLDGHQVGTVDPERPPGTMPFFFCPWCPSATGGELVLTDEEDTHGGLGEWLDALQVLAGYWGRKLSGTWDRPDEGFQLSIGELGHRWTPP